MRRVFRLAVLSCAFVASTLALQGPVSAMPVLPRTLMASRSVLTTLGAGHDQVMTVALPYRVNMVGLSFVSADPHGLDVTLRVRTHNDTGWDDWEPATLSDEPGPDGAEARRASPRVFTDPIWVGTADGLEVDATVGMRGTPIRDLRAHLFNTEGDAVSSGPLASLAHFFGRVIRGTSKPAEAQPAQPSIITRKGWGADPRLLHPPGPGTAPTVKMAFVHHTDTTNNYTPSQSAAQVRAIYAYHTQSLGYYDIAYNFIVDKYGQVFEGRTGGIDQPVIGAHTGGYNYESTGVALLGTYSNVAPSAAMVSALERLLAWKLDLTHTPSTGTTTMVTGSNNDKHAQGTVVTFNRISGHRDASYTDCPGTQAYGLLPSIRSVVSGWGNPKIVNASASGALLKTDGSSPSTVTVVANFSQPVSWRVTFSNDDGTAQRTISGSGSSVSATWNGLDDHGTLVPTGAYRWEIDANAGSASALPAYGFLDVAGRYLDGTLLSDATGPFTIVQGQMRALDATTQSSLYGARTPIAVGGSERSLYAAGNAMPLRDGTLLHSSDGTYDFWSDGAVRKFTADPTQAPLSYQSGAALDVDASYISGLPSGSNITSTAQHPDGTAVRDSGGATWVIDAGTRRPATALAIASTYRSNEVVPATSGDLALPVGDAFPVRDGTLVSSSEGGAGWIVEGGEKLRFTDPSLFSGMGYVPSMRIAASAPDLAALPEGTPVGATLATPVVGDWNGDGTDTIGYVRAVGANLEWHLRNADTIGAPDLVFNFGLTSAGDQPVVGDWNGDGIDTIGVVRRISGALEWHLRDSNSSGSSTRVFTYGLTAYGDQPVVGDWNGDGADTIGVVRRVSGALEWHERDSNSSGGSNRVFTYGLTGYGDEPVVGDWNGDRVVTIGVVRRISGVLEWHERDSNSSGGSNRVFTFGVTAFGDQELTGNWNGDPYDSIGVVRGTAIQTRDSNSSGLPNVNWVPSL